MTRATLGFAAAALAASLGAAEPVTLPEFAVNAERRLRASETVGPTRWFDAEALQAPLAVDRALRADPAFSLFRRSDSLAANPTAQGVSLRGLGPSGASRSLVLLDGVPLNDPFGGWVQWAQLPTTALAGAEIVPGGGSAAWGNAALGGVIALATQPPGRAPDALRFTAGSFATRGIELGVGATDGGVALRTDLRWFDSDGFHPLRAADRGPIDQALSNTHRLAQFAAAGRLGAVDARLTLRHFAEERGNGTALQNNATRLDAAQLSLAGALPHGAWQVTAYRQSQTFRSFFSAVSADRATETPANDQFAVPADAAGLGITAAGTRDATTWSAGGDWRTVRGETREDFLFSSGTFARRRFAGGRQEFFGGFLGAEWEFAAGVKLGARLRGDHWRLFDGHRREVERATNVAVRDERFAARRGTEWTGQIEVSGPVVAGWSWRSAAYSAFRVPTLNELHRPFRVGNTNTEANPALAPETLRGGEAGLTYGGGYFSAAVTVFTNELRQAVGNVTLASTPTLVSRQRLNLDRVRVRGVEARAAWAPSDRWRVEGALLGVDASVRSAAVQAALAGRRLAQVPRVTLTGSVTWRPTAAWELRANGRWSARQFEDDENLLPLGAAGTIDVSVERRFASRASVRLAVENVGDVAVPVARTAGGPTSFGSPRTVTARLTCSF